MIDYKHVILKEHDSKNIVLENLLTRRCTLLNREEQKQEKTFEASRISLDLIFFKEIVHENSYSKYLVKLPSMNFSKICAIKVDTEYETTIKLVVKTLTGKTINIEIGRHATVEELMEKV